MSVIFYVLFYVLSCMLCERMCKCSICVSYLSLMYVDIEPQ